MCTKMAGRALSEKLSAAEIREVAVLIHRQGAGEDRMMLRRAHRNSIDELGFADLEEGVVGREHVELFAIVGVGGAHEHRAGRRQHGIAQRLEFGADRGELSALNTQIEALMRQAENCWSARAPC